MEAELLEIRPLSGQPHEIRDLQAVLEAAPGYHERVSGLAPSPGAAEDLLASLPPNKTSEDKFLFGIYVQDRMVGCADVVRGYPINSTAMVGLLLMAEQQQGRGLGAAAYRRVEEIARGWPGCSCVRIGVVANNSGVLPFWQKMGFLPTGERKAYENGDVSSEVIVLEKPLW